MVVALISLNVTSSPSLGFRKIGTSSLERKLFATSASFAMWLETFSSRIGLFSNDINLWRKAGRISRKQHSSRTLIRLSKLLVWSNMLKGADRMSAVGKFFCRYCVLALMSAKFSVFLLSGGLSCSSFSATAEFTSGKLKIICQKEQHRYFTIRYYVANPCRIPTHIAPDPQRFPTAPFDRNIFP